MTESTVSIYSHKGSQGIRFSTEQVPETGIAGNDEWEEGHFSVSGHEGAGESRVASTYSLQGGWGRSH